MYDELTKSEREALKAIYRSTRDGSEAHTGSLAETLGLSPGTVTTLVKRLADRGLVVHRPYQGVTFTDEGRRAAVGAIRRHRIVERFLADMLGYAWNEADAYAVAFEHELPAEVTERLYTALHRPATCPHGFPIPQPEDADLPATPELYDLAPGDIAEIAVSGSTDAEIVSFLETLGRAAGRRSDRRREAPVRRAARRRGRGQDPHAGRAGRPPGLRDPYPYGRRGQAQRQRP